MTLKSDEKFNLNAFFDEIQSDYYRKISTERTIEYIQKAIENGFDINTPFPDSGNITLLHWAAITDNTTLMRWLLNNRADANALDVQGRNALHYAESPKAVDMLVYAGGDVNCPDENGQSPLSLKLSGRHEPETLNIPRFYLNGVEPELVQEYLKRGADTLSVDKNGRTLTYYMMAYPQHKEINSILSPAIQMAQKYAQVYNKVAQAYDDGKERTEIRNLITQAIENGYDINYSPYTNHNRMLIHLAAMNNDLETMDLLAQYHRYTDVRTINNESPLHLITDAKLVPFLREKGVNINTLSKGGMNPLTIAIVNNDVAMVRALIDAGADMDLADYDGKTAFDYAWEQSRLSDNADNKAVTEIWDIMQKRAEAYNSVKMGSPLYSFYNKGEFPQEKFYQYIVKAYETGKNPFLIRQTINAAIEAGYDVNYTGQSDDNMTLTHIAALNNDEETIRLLSEKGLNINQPTGTGRTVAHLISDATIISPLKEIGLNINVRDNDGNTPLLMNAEMGSLKMMTALIENGADVFAQNTDGSITYDLLLRYFETQENLNEEDVNKTVYALNDAMQQQTPESYDEFRSRYVADNTKKTGYDAAFYYYVQQSYRAGKDNALIRQDIEAALKDGYDINYQPYWVNNETLLHLAARHNDTDTIRTLAVYEKDVNRKSLTGETVAHLITNPDLIPVLKEYGVDINMRDNNGNTPLLSHISAGNDAMIMGYVRNGADVSLLDGNGKSPLNIYEAILSQAHQNGTLTAEREAVTNDALTTLAAATQAYMTEVEFNEIIRQYENGQLSGQTFPLNDDRNRIISYYIMNGYEAGKDREKMYADMEKAIRAGYNLDYEPNTDGYKLLHIAALNNDRNLIRLFDKYDTDNNKRTPAGETIAHLITDESIVSYAQIYGMDINAQDNEGVTPLMKNVLTGNTKMVERLIERGADLSLRDNAGQTVLDYAREQVELTAKDTENNTPEIQRRATDTLAVVEKGLQDIRDKELYERVVRAYQQGAGYQSVVVRNMLNEGYNPTFSTREHNRQNLLHLAVIHNDVETVRLLAGQKGMVDSWDGNGMTPLALNIENQGATEITAILLEKNARPTARNFAGVSVTELAGKKVENAIELDETQRRAAIENQQMLAVGPRKYYTQREYDAIVQRYEAGEIAQSAAVSAFVKKGYDITYAPDEKGGKTLLHYAVIHNDIDTVSILANQKGTDIPDNNGQTPLALNVSRDGNPAITRKLMQAGFNHELADNSGKSAWDYAKDNANNQTELSQNARANLYQIDTHDWTRRSLAEMERQKAIEEQQAAIAVEMAKLTPTPTSEPVIEETLSDEEATQRMIEKAQARAIQIRESERLAKEEAARRETEWLAKLTEQSNDAARRMSDEIQIDIPVLTEVQPINMMAYAPAETPTFKPEHTVVDLFGEEMDISNVTFPSSKDRKSKKSDKKSDKKDDKKSGKPTDKASSPKVETKSETGTDKPAQTQTPTAKPKTVVKPKGTLLQSEPLTGKELEEAQQHAEKRNTRIKSGSRKKALKNIRRMEELGLIPTGVGGESMADIYLYKLYQGKVLLTPKSELMMKSAATGELKEIKAGDVLSGTKKQTISKAYRDLTTKELTDEQLEMYAQLLYNVNAVINNRGNVVGESGKKRSGHLVEQPATSGLNQTLSQAQQEPEEQSDDEKSSGLKGRLGRVSSGDSKVRYGGKSRTI